MNETATFDAFFDILHLSNCNDITNSQPWIINSINSE